jgi:hypothetical protein
MPEIKSEYGPMDKYKTCIFLDTDEQGNITTSYIGKNAIPDRQYDYFFYKDAYVGESIQNYRIVNGELQAIDTDLEQQLITAYSS